MRGKDTFSVFGLHSSRWLLEAAGDCCEGCGIVQTTNSSGPLSSSSTSLAFLLLCLGSPRLPPYKRMKESEMVIDLLFMKVKSKHISFSRKSTSETVNGKSIHLTNFVLS